MSALKARQSQRRIPVRFDLGIDICAHVEEKFHSGSVPVHGSQHQRRNTKFATSSWIDLRTVR